MSSTEPIARRTRREPRHCGWCGRSLPEAERGGRPRRYCGQACRQRAYERRTAAERTGIPDDAVVLSSAELGDLQDRLFQLRCAAEDVHTAAAEGAELAELRDLAERLVTTVRELEYLR
ncbi:hypothetical protein [Sciscionella sediminilitoris]|uniref:hypothetical protein n=1 Tax=Sciscionella sediminilitoris TaxID=1445613 RepID=UPI0004DFBB1E|nr:hypothetical protein [Sciscionella sp. SE31]